MLRALRAFSWNRPSLKLWLASQLTEDWTPHKIQGMDASVPGVMEGEGVLEGVPGNREWTNLPNVWRNGDHTKLNGNWCDNRYYNNALPVLWEFSHSSLLVIDLSQPPSIFPASLSMDSKER